MVRRLEIVKIPRFGELELLSTKIRNRRFPAHFHDTFVIELVASGTDVCEITGLAATAQQVFVHAPNAVHAGRPSKSDTLTYRALYPSLSLTEQLIGPVPKLAPVSFVSECRSLARLVATFDVARSTAFNGHQLSELMQRVVDLTVSATAQADQPGPIPDAICLARHYLIEHCRRDVTVAELSAVTLLSPFHLIRAFKGQFGITPRQFLITQRVLDAKHQLASGIPITAAAMAAGFSDQSHLTRCFKRVLGFNPGEFQRGFAGR